MEPSIDANETLTLVRQYVEKTVNWEAIITKAATHPGAIDNVAEAIADAKTITDLALKSLDNTTTMLYLVSVIMSAIPNLAGTLQFIATDRRQMLESGGPDGGTRH